MARTVKISKASKELTKVEKIALQDTSDCLSIDKVVGDCLAENKQCIITPKDFVLLNIHNDTPKQGGSEDYITLVVIDRNGNKYATGSTSFAEAFLNIWDGMHEDEDDPVYSIRVLRRDSNNYKGKYFLTCGIVA